MKFQKKLAVLFTVIAMIFLFIPTGVKAAAGTYNIIYIANAKDVTGEMKGHSFVYGVPTNKLKANVYALEGHQFNGWNTMSDGSGNKVADQAGEDDYAAYIVENTLTLYAQWKADTAPAPAPATAPAPKATAVSSGWIPSFEIQFLDCNGKVISDQWVGDGQPAAIPDGYTYGEEELNWVYRNLTVSPIGCKVSGFVVPDTADKN